MRSVLILLVLAVALLAIAPAADAQPPSGGHCEVKEEYVTGASIGRDPNNPTSLPGVKPGAPRPIECYY